MATLEDPPRPRAVGAQGEPCAQCGSSLAADQRYCLACGARRSGLAPTLSPLPERGAREPDSGAAGPPPSPLGAVAGPPALPPEPWRANLGLLAGAACLLLALLVGVLIGRSGEDPPRAQAPIVVSGGTAATGTATPTSFTSDWPASKRGWTVQLRALPKEGTDAAAVAAAKADATAKGAAAVGALDSDEFATLDPGAYVIFSGQFASRREARAAVAGLKASFPEAAAVEVAANEPTRASSASSAGGSGAGEDVDAATGGAGKVDEATQRSSQAALQELQKAASDPEAYSKQSQRIPDKVATGGPAKEVTEAEKSKPIGAGGDVETFE